MSSVKELLAQFQEIVGNPVKQKDAYLAEGRKVLLTAPVYTPEELIHSFGMVPMGAWGADMELKESKRYFPAFICSIVQSILELGANGTYEGVSAIVIPSLCDSLKVLGENWKYAVPSIPFIPMTYPQNRKPAYGKTFTKHGYERVIGELEKISGLSFDDRKLEESIAVYNEHNACMREFAGEVANHPEITMVQRSAVFKSAFFMRKEEHTRLVKELLEAWKTEGASQETEGAKSPAGKISIVTTGVLADSPSLLELLDQNGLLIAADDVAAESRQYRTDTPLEGSRDAGAAALDRLAEKFSAMDNCSVLYDPQKNRIPMIVEMAKKNNAKGVLMVLTKFCDPEEFDYPLLKRACDAAGLPIILVEADRQMENYEQAATMIETFREMMEQ